MKRFIAALALSLLLTSCSKPTGGAEEIIRIEGGNSAGYGTVCDSTNHALDLVSGEFSQQLPCIEQGQSDTRAGGESFEHRATLTTEKIESVRETLGGQESSQLLTQPEKAAEASQAKNDSCEDGGGSSLIVTYSDESERTIETGCCGVDASAEVLAPLNILPEIGDEHGFTSVEFEAACAKILEGDR
mgnify:CR=1 FL=1